MKHFSYISEDIYTYENLDELKRIIEFDEIGLTTINEQEQSIQYQINREKCIRLSDLVYFISFKLVRIHLAQLLVLVKSLALKVQQLQQEKIEHYYLDCNRIWLKFNNFFFNYKYEIVNYTIHFTGYQCPNYEDQNEQGYLQINSSQKILNIIKYIIDNCFDKIILKQNQNDVKKNIIDPILNGMHNKTLGQLIKKIDDILGENQFDQEKQIISVDEYVDKIFEKRHEHSFKYKLDIQKIMETTEQMQPTPLNAYILEYCLYSSLPSIVQQLEQTQYQRIQYEPNKTKNVIEKIYSDIQTNIQNYISEQVKQEIQKQILYSQQLYKFEFHLDEISKILTTIFNNHAIIRYFYNTYTYFIKYTFNSYIDNQDVYISNANQLYGAMQKAIQKIIPLYVEQYFIMEITLKILELVNDLI